MLPVCIFAKPFEPNRVKTRLAPELGAQGAAELAQAMFYDVWSAAVSCRDAHPVLATVAAGDFGVPLRECDIWLQGEGDLGARLERIFRRGLQMAAGTLAIGADSPVIMPEHIAEAIDLLCDYDAVMGRCEDGGFYLLGLSRCPPDLFDSLPWSTSQTAAAVAERLTNHGFRLAEISSLFDVDTPGDLRKLSQWLRAQPDGAFATRAWLARKDLHQAR